MKKHLSSIVLFGVFVLGLALLIYPSFSDWWNSRVQSHAIMDYDAAVQSLTQKDYSEWFEAADAYNEAVAGLEYPFMNYGQLSDRSDLQPYDELLNVTGTGIMGYITIPKIDVELPIYHGVSESVLAVAAGHLHGSSLPVGGEGTHAVISAHRGLPSAKLFTYLDRLEVGDSFTVTVLDRVMTYEVDQVLIVEPNQVDGLYVVDGQDYVTLLTCTPYGINTQRLLVRGHRIQTPTATNVYVPADVYKVNSVVAAPAVAAPILLLLLVILLVKYRKKEDADERDQDPRIQAGPLDGVDFGDDDELAALAARRPAARPGSRDVFGPGPRTVGEHFGQRPDGR